MDKRHYFDFNDISAFSSTRYDRDELIAGLSAHVKEWGPALFPFAVNYGNKLRMADVYGRAPRANGAGGSCHLELEGEKAGFIYDFSEQLGGDPIAAVAFGTGLSHRALFDRAAEYAHITNGHATHRTVKPAPAAKKKKDNYDLEIKDILSKCVPIAGTLGEIYLKSRELIDPKSPDLLFCGDCTDWKAKRSRPAIIARLRDNNGNLVDAIHRLFLKDDGSGKAEMADPGQSPKMSLGSHRGTPACVQLFPITDTGRMGYAEGIESAIAGHILRGMPVWAVLSVGNFKDTRPPNGVSHVTIFEEADGGDGTKKAHELAEELQKLKIECVVDERDVGKDANDDLLASRGRPYKPRVPIATENNEAQQATLNIEITAPDPQAQVIPPAGSPAQPEENIEASLLDEARRFESSKATTEQLKNFLFVVAQNRKNIGPLALKEIFTHFQRASMIRRSLKDITNQFDELVNSLKPPKPPTPAVYSVMTMTPYDTPERCMLNAVTMFNYFGQTKDLFGYDEFSEMPMVMKRAPWDRGFGSFIPRRLTDEDVINALFWVQENGLIIPKVFVIEAIEKCCQQFKFHPVKDCLNGYQWDGITRSPTWLVDYLHAETPVYIDKERYRSYVSTIGTKYLNAMIARIFEPGCQVDSMLVLEGPENVGKSTAIRKLGHPWAREMSIGLASKDAQQALDGVWVMVLSELASIRGAKSVEHAKDFISKPEDHYRRPYGRFFFNKKRQNVFAATTNRRNWLSDDTGGRRYWPIFIMREINTDRLEEVVPQLLAEAVFRYKNKESWYIDNKEVVETARIEQEARQEDDPWFDILSDFLERKISDSIRIMDLLEEPLKIDPEKRGKAAQSRVQQILLKLGYERDYEFNSRGQRKPIYKRIKSDLDDIESMDSSE